jgi:hypothetical protein
MSNKKIYLAAFYFMHPRRHVNTTVKGWMNNPDNIQWDEKVEITRGEKKNALNAKILLDLSTKTVVRNSWGDNRSFDDLFKYFFKGYHQYITQVMTKLDAEYFNEMLDEMQSELHNEKETENETVPAE